MQNNQNNEIKNISNNEIKKLKDEIIQKENQINKLKLELQNEKNKNNKKLIDLNDILAITFISETNNTFIVNGTTVLRFKKMSENNIKNGDTIQLIKNE